HSSLCPATLSATLYSLPGPPAPLSFPTRRSSDLSTGRAVIGRSITLRGDVTGDEDLVIQGRVEGSVDLGQHSVTVGADGEVNARSEEHTSELQSRENLVCRLLLEKKKKTGTAR